MEAEPKVKSKRKTETALVILAWVAATGFAAEGAWEFFGNTLGLAEWMRWFAFALFEITALACAVFARRKRIDDVDSRWGGRAGVAVWVVAGISGMLSASDEPQPFAKFARFIAPLISAFLFDLLTSGEQGDARERKGKRRKRINFKFSPERIMVRIGLADASDRSAEEAARDKAIARVATLCHRSQLELKQAKGKGSDRRAQGAERRYRRALEDANERFGLAKDPRLMAQLHTSIALLTGAMDMTSPEAMAASVNPWASARRPGASSTRPASSAGERTTSRVTTRTVPTDDGRGRYSNEERIEQYDAVAAANPGQTQEFYAAAIGLRPRQLREVLRKAGRAPATTSVG